MSVAVMQPQQRSIQQPDYTAADVIKTIKETVAKGATDAQLAMFLEVCRATGLNCFLHEIWFVPGVGIMAGRDGYLRVANEHPQFDGIETRVDRDDNSVPIKATCTVWRKDRSHPTVCEAYYNEYKKSSQVWQTYKSAMIGKVAEVLALKRAFSINGVITEEEVGEQEPQGSIEAAQEVAKRKIAERKAKPAEPGVVDVAPLAICAAPEGLPEEQRTELTNEIRATLNAMSPAYDAADPKSMAAYKAQVAALQQDAFGVPSWKAITNLPLEGMRAGLAYLKAKANTTPEDSLEAIWSDNFKMLADFAKEKARVGSVTYYELLNQFGVTKSNQFKTPQAGIKCFMALRSEPDAEMGELQGEPME